MKKYLLFSLTILIFSAINSSVQAIPNPAAVYAQKLGYECKVVKTRAGEKSLVTLPSGEIVAAWDFFRGKSGSEHAYGAQFGYDTSCKRVETNGYVQEYAVCVPRGARKLSDGSFKGEITLLDLMEQNGEPLLDDSHRPIPPAFITAEAQPPLKTFPKKALPPAFDWRSYNGHAYIGSPRDQAACGSCYAFGAAAAAEGSFNYYFGKYDANCVDFSEAYIAWCLGTYGAYSANFGGCDGADYEYAELQALTSEGICVESQMPYNAGADPSSCTYAGTTTVFQSWGRTISGDYDSIKTAIMTYGVVDAAVQTDAGFDSYATGVYDNANNACPDGYYTSSDHAISLVGWDDNPPEGGGGCWILRNSWGPSGWGENGYMRIRYNAAAVHCAASYIIYAPPTGPFVNITNPPLASLNLPYGRSNYTVCGTCNSNTVGQLRWTNRLTGVFGTTSASGSWSLGSVALYVGTNVITVRGTNSTGVAATNSVSIIRQTPVPAQPPVITYMPTGSVHYIPAGRELAVQVIATEPNGDFTTLEALSLPSGASFPGATGYSPVSETFSWTPPTTGVYQASFRAYDVDGSITSKMDIYVQSMGSLTNIAFQGFEGTPTDTWKVVAANAITNVAGASDTPANQRVRTGSKSWQPGEGAFIAETLELTNVNISGYGDVVVQIRLSATSTEAGYGMWPTETIGFYAALNGGGYPVTADIEIQGNELLGGGINGVLWGYSATNVASTTAGVARVFFPPAGGVSASGYSTIRIALPNGTTSVKLRAVTYISYAGYLYNVDDILITGRRLTNPSTPPDLGSGCAISGAGQMIFRWSSDTGEKYRVTRSTNLVTDPFTHVVASNLNINAYTSPVGVGAVNVYRIEKE